MIHSHNQKLRLEDEKIHIFPPLCTALWEGASSGAPKICLIKMWNTLKIKNTLKMIFY
jgi:hypothetical protein